MRTGSFISFWGSRALAPWVRGLVAREAPRPPAGGRGPPGHIAAASGGPEHVSWVLDRVLWSLVYPPLFAPLTMSP